jgi:hypothetical protein
MNKTITEYIVRPWTKNIYLHMLSGAFSLNIHLYNPLSLSLSLFLSLSLSSTRVLKVFLFGSLISSPRTKYSAVRCWQAALAGGSVTKRLKSYLIYKLPYAQKYRQN